MPDDEKSNKTDLLKLQWTLASEIHRHEDNLIWQRFSYFVLMIGGVFAFIASIIDRVYGNSKLHIIFMALVFFVSGTVSIALFLVL